MLRHSLLFFACILPAHAGERLALLIGNASYDEKIGILKNPHNDITLVGTALSRLGFKVTIIKDADSDTLRNAIYEHVQSVKNAGPGTINFFYYYSGHGAPDEKTKKNFLIPINVRNAEDSSIWSKSLDIKRDVLDEFHIGAPDAIQYIVFDAS